jgi:hypothetical protein
MNRLNSRRAVAFGLLLSLVVHAGCGKKQNVTVTGTVLRGGQPLKVSPSGVLQVTLVPDMEGDENFTSAIAECDRATGAFKILDVVPGKYKIGVEQFDPNPQTDKFNAAFRADTGKIVREIDGKEPLTIDLAKP